MPARGGREADAEEHFNDEFSAVSVFAASQPAARARRGAAGCLTPASPFDSHAAFLETSLVPTRAREMLTLTCRKRGEKPPEGMWAVSPGGTAKGTRRFWPRFFTGAMVGILRGPLRSSLWSCHTGSGCTFSRDQRRGGFPWHPWRLELRRGVPCHGAFPLPPPGSPSCPCLAGRPQVEGTPAASAARMAAGLIAA